MHSINSRLMATILLIILMTGCSSIQRTVSVTPKSKVTDTLYLRGIFNFWEASDAYIAAPVSEFNNRWSATVELIADGKPYDWKFGDKNWQCGSSFGVKSGETVIMLDQRREADPCADFGSFQFTPPEDGRYQFILDWSRSVPEVIIQRAQ